MRSLLSLITFIACLGPDVFAQSTVGIASNIPSSITGENAEFYVSSHAIENFRSRYRGAENALWSITNEGSTVKFLLKGMDYSVRYNKNGRWRSTLKKIPVQLLNRSLANEIRLTFPRYAIFFAQHLRTSAGSVYLIKIERDNEWKAITVREGVINVTGEYVRN
jgi:hypothetical protein